MKGQTNRSVLDNALQKKLRTHMTDAENRLWKYLRGRQMTGFKFRRQHPFLGYVLDFVCLEMRLIVEVDGGQHQDCEADQVRDRRLHEAGFRIMRFWNNQVLQETDAVVEAIWMALQHESGDAASLLTPSPPQPVQSQTSLTRPSP
jgi:very-short-patch-repair endonuclease